MADKVRKLSGSEELPIFGELEEAQNRVRKLKSAITIQAVTCEALFENGALLNDALMLYSDYLDDILAKLDDVGSCAVQQMLEQTA